MRDRPAGLKLFPYICFVISLTILSGYAGADQYSVKVPVGEFKTVMVENDITRIAIATPEIADYTPISKREVLVSGKTIGSTSMKVWTTASISMYRVDVIDLRQAKLESLLSNPNVRVVFAGDDIILSGTVSSQREKSQAGETAKAFTSGKGGVKNLISISGLDTLNSKVQKIINNPDVVVSYTDRGIILSGRVESEQDKQKVEKVVRAYIPDVEQDVTNVLEIRRKPRQVRMKVRVMEMTENATKTYGIDWGTFQFSGVTSVVNPSASAYHNEYVLSGARTASAFPRMILPLRRSQPFNAVDPFMLVINNLIDSGVLTILSEPEIVALSGAKSDVLIGGQIPIPSLTTSGGSTNTSIEWKDHGIKLTLEPTIHEDNWITAKIYTVVSTLDKTNGVVVSGVIVPALKITEATSEVHVESGKTIFLSGFKSVESAKTEKGIAGLSGLPIVGDAFGTKTRDLKKKELIISVTPEIIDGGGGL